MKFGKKKGNIWPEFHGNVQKMTKCVEILRKVREKIGKCYKFPEFVRNFIFRFIFSFVSFLFSRVELAGREVRRHGGSLAEAADARPARPVRQKAAPKVAIRAAPPPKLLAN